MQGDYAKYLADELVAGRLTRREFVRRCSVIGLSVPAISLLLAACGSPTPATSQPPSSGTPGPKRGGTLKVGVITPSTGLDPVFMFDAGAIATVQQVAEYLVWAPGSLVLQGVLATSWAPGAAADTWTFNLRQGVTFSDGSAFGADDVVATFDRLTDPAVNSAALSAFQGILSKGKTQKVDDHTVTFHLDRPVGDFPYLLTGLNYNSVILPKGYSIASSPAPPTFQTSPVGTGPWMLANYVPKQSATFKPNPNYWNKPRPYLDAMVIKFYSDNAPEVIALQSGDIDIMVETPFQGSQALFSDPNIKTSFVSSSQYRELHMQVTQKPWDDKRVRQAFALSLDRNAIVQALFNGNADVGNDHGFAPVFPTFVQIPQRAQDVNQAKSLLAAAGYPNGFNVTLTTENYLEIPQYVTIVKQQAAAAGINITLNVEDQNTYYGSGANQPWLSVPFGCVDWASRGSASQLITPAYTSTGIWNSAKWSNSNFDTLLKQYDAEPDLTKRKGLAQQLETIQNDEVPAVIAYFVKLPHAMRKNVQGVVVGDTIYLPGAYLA